MPVSVLLGRHDQLVPALVSDDLSALRPGLPLRILEGSGHVPFLAQPEAFEQAVNELLAEMGIA